MLHIAWRSSENRAAAALGRNYPGGIRAFVAAMNTRARELGMDSSQFSDSTGLNSTNVSSARDLAKLVVAAYQHPLIRQYSTCPLYPSDAADEKKGVESGGITTTQTKNKHTKHKTTYNNETKIPWIIQ